MSLKGNLDEIDIAIIQIQNLEPKLQEYIDANIVELCKTYIITEIIHLAHAANLPPKFSDGLDVIPAGKGSAKIINTWGTSSKPLAKWFNNGTPDHFIFPLGDWPLHWKTPEGTDAYSRGHKVRGLPQTRVMEIGIEIGMKYLIAFVLTEGKMEVSQKVGIV